MAEQAVGLVSLFEALEAARGDFGEATAVEATDEPPEHHE